MADRPPHDLEGAASSPPAPSPVKPAADPRGFVVPDNDPAPGSHQSERWAPGSTPILSSCSRSPSMSAPGAVPADDEPGPSNGKGKVFAALLPDGEGPLTIDVHASGPCDGPACLSPDDEPECWICLGSCQFQSKGAEPEELLRPCACPRFVHPTCMARWQLRCAGQPQERACRFCSQALPPWHRVLHIPDDATGEMKVDIRGRSHTFVVWPGLDGFQAFKSRLLHALGVPRSAPLEYRFDCADPFSGENITLVGESAFDAAVMCTIHGTEPWLRDTHRKMRKLIIEAGLAHGPSPTDLPLEVLSLQGIGTGGAGAEAAGRNGAGAGPGPASAGGATVAWATRAEGGDVIRAPRRLGRPAPELMAVLRELWELEERTVPGGLLSGHGRARGGTVSDLDRAGVNYRPNGRLSFEGPGVGSGVGAGDASAASARLPAGEDVGELGVAFRPRAAHSLDGGGRERRRQLRDAYSRSRSNARPVAAAELAAALAPVAAADAAADAADAAAAAAAAGPEALRLSIPVGAAQAAPPSTRWWAQLAWCARPAVQTPDADDAARPTAFRSPPRRNEGELAVGAPAAAQ